MFVGFVIVIVIAVITGAFALQGYATWRIFSGWQDIFKLYGDVIAADRKRRAEQAVGNRGPQPSRGKETTSRL